MKKLLRKKSVKGFFLIVPLPIILICKNWFAWFHFSVLCLLWGWGGIKMAIEAFLWQIVGSISTASLLKVKFFYESSSWSILVDKD